MPELRKDPIIGRWVIISTERGKRPTDFKSTTPETMGGYCPFCPGNEDKTPPELYALRPDDAPEPNSGGWINRVVANKFPALKSEGLKDKVGEGMFDKMNGIGAHEVVIETPDHCSTLEDLSDDLLVNVFTAYRERVLALSTDERFRYILIFKNHGIEAGASLEHTHSQLIALPIIPNLVREEIEGAVNHYKLKDRCVYCDIIRQELSDHKRIVSENSGFVTLSPYAPRFPFETWILPKNHFSAFEDTPEEQLLLLARALKDTLWRLNKILNNPPYNLVIHTSPIADKTNEYYHWHMEIMPKLTKVAGFEWGTGFYINPTPPEEAAAFLRDVK